MPDNHSPRFRVGTSNNYIAVHQPIDPGNGEWKAPLIYIPEIKGINPPAANAVQKALGKAIAACTALNKYTGRRAR